MKIVENKIGKQMGMWLKILVESIKTCDGNIEHVNMVYSNVTI